MSVGIALAAALAGLQTVEPRAPTVGDTVVVTRAVAVAPGAIVRAQALPAGERYAMLRPPEIIPASTDQVLVRYTLVFWQSGDQTLDLPGPVVISARGGADTLPPQRTRFAIRSVLPPAPVDSIPPQPATPFVPRAVRTWWPAAALAGLAILAVLPVHWLWRRRRPPVPAGHPPPLARTIDPDRLAQWTRCEETGTAARHWVALLEASDREPPPPADLLAALRRDRRPEDRDALARAIAQAAAWWSR